MSKPQEILDLEIFYGITLEKISYTKYDENDCYELNKNGDVITLTIEKNAITDLEPLAKLRTLEKLFLSYNNITSLLPLQNLKNLEILYLGYNEISSIEPLQYIKKLKTLVLDKNKLTEINSLQFLVNLKFLNLDDNHLTSLDSTRHLKNLETLYFENNQVDSIEPLRNLDNLVNLYVNNNLLTSLEPIQKQIISKKITIYCENNPFEEKLIAILENRNTVERMDNLSNYFINLAEGGQPLHEAKLMILGEADSGKTNLANYLMDLPFNNKNSSTVGIAVGKWTLPHNGTNYRINIWDFGGQWMQQQVHRFFITNECLYIIMLKPHTDDAPDAWLEWIKAFAPNAKAIIVVNRIDELNGQSFTLAQNTIKANYPFVIGFHYISLLNANFNNINEAKLAVSQLRLEIETQLLNLPSINAPTPTSYINFKKTLEDSVFINRPFISYEYFEELLTKNNVLGNKEDLLKTFNEIGTLRFFKNTPQRFILNPEWLSAGVYKLTTSQRTEQLKGVITDSDFAIILQKTENDKFEYSKNDYDYLRKIMVEFKLGYFDSKTQICFIPKQFQKDIPEVILLNNIFTNDYIYYYFQYEGYFPDSLVSQFIAENFNLVYNNYYWQEGIMLHQKDDDLNEETIAYIKSDTNKKRIELKVIGHNKKVFFYEIKKSIRLLQNDFALNYKEISIDVITNTVVDYETLLLHYNMGLEVLHQKSEDKRLITINVKAALGFLQNERETKKEVQTNVSYNTITNNFNVNSDYHYKGENFNYKYTFYELAPNFNEILNELEKVKTYLTELNQKSFHKTLQTFEAVTETNTPDKAKNIFQKALARLKNFPKTIDSEAEKLAAKKLIELSLTKLNTIYETIDWNNVIKKFDDLYPF